MKTESIIITNYNRQDFIDRAIRSCLDQLLFSSYDLEILVVDDGSTDNSIEVLSRYDSNIKLFKHKKNLGVAAASNTGVKNATGDFILRLDADDFLNKLNIFSLANILEENPQYSFVYTDHFRVDEKGFKTSRVSLDCLEQLYEHGAGVMFRKKVFDDIGLYDESLKNCEDYDFLIRVTRKLKGFYLPLALYRYYIHGENISLNSEREKYKKIVRDKYEI